MKTIQKVIVCAAICTLACSCSDNSLKKTSDNPSEFLTDDAKIALVHSLKALDGDRFLEMDYTLDYDLDEMIDYNCDSFEKFLEYLCTHMMDVAPSAGSLPAPSSGCSAFATTNKDTGDKLMGRNYDFCHVENGEEVPITALMIKTSPKNGKKSISMADSYWLGYKKGFYSDGKSDLSMLIGAPYSVLDGMNEDGFAVGVLHLLGNPTAQNDPAKKTIWSSVLMRVMLDRASTVDEAIEIAKTYNLNLVNPADGSSHLFLADAAGNYAILEYTFEPGADVDSSVPNRLIALQGEKNSYVTNFYVDPDLADNAFLGGKSEKGMARYLILKGTLWLNAYKLTEEQAKDLLKAVSQTVKPEENTSHTQWSALYNLTQKTMDVSLLREFDKTFSFKVE